MNRFFIQPTLNALLLLPLAYAIPVTAEAGADGYAKCLAKKQAS